MTEIERQMIDSLRRIEAEHAAWSDACETLQREYALIRKENAALHGQVEQLSGQVEQLIKRFTRLNAR